MFLLIRRSGGGSPRVRWHVRIYWSIPWCSYERYRTMMYKLPPHKAFEADSAMLEVLPMVVPWPATARSS